MRRFSSAIDNISATSKHIANAFINRESHNVHSFVSQFGAISSLNDAYSIQYVVSQILETQHGFKRKGHKIGATTETLQLLRGLTEPLASPFYNTYSIHKEQIGIESEYMFRIGQTLNIEKIKQENREINIDDIKPCIIGIYPGFELIDPRIIDNDGYIFDLPAEYLVADLCAGAGILINEDMNMMNNYKWNEIEQGLIENKVELYFDDELIKTGPGKVVMGSSPLNVIQWLYNFLLKQNKTVNDGEIISSGTCTANVLLSKGQTAKAVFQGLGEVFFRL